MKAEDYINARGREQHGVISLAQLLTVVDEAWVYRERKSGRLRDEGPAAYRVGGAPRTWEARAMAAVFAARGPALISHRSAAYLWGLVERPPGVIDLTVPRERRPRTRVGVQVHQSRAFELAGPQIRNRLPVTGAARTILDCCAVMDQPLARLELFDEARRLKLVDWDELWACALAHAGRGWRAPSAFREILIARDGATPPGTKFARRVGLLLEGAGLPAPVYEHPVVVGGQQYYLDIAWPDRMVAVECLGKIGHAYERAFEKDPVRRNRLGLAGWFVLEVTWKRFVDQPQAFLDEVRQSLCGYSGERSAGGGCG